MKRQIIALAAAALLAASLTSCKKSGESGSTAAVSTQESSDQTEKSSAPNPMKEVDSALAFEEIGIHIIEPDQAKQAEYFLISGSVADIEFVLDGVNYTYRASNTAEDFAGIFERFKEETLSPVYEYEDGSAKAEIKTTDSNGRLASWTWADTDYTLYTAGPVEDDAITQLVLDLMELSQHEKAEGE